MLFAGDQLLFSVAEQLLILQHEHTATPGFWCVRQMQPGMQQGMQQYLRVAWREGWARGGGAGCKQQEGLLCSGLAADLLSAADTVLHRCVTRSGDRQSCTTFDYSRLGIACSQQSVHARHHKQLVFNFTPIKRKQLSTRGFSMLL